MGELVEMPGQKASKREDLFKALAGLVNIVAALAFVTAIPLNVWLWTVAL